LIDQAYTSTGADRALAGTDTQARADAVVSIAAIARRYGVVPAGALTHLQAMAANGSTEQQIFALQAAATIETARPGVFTSTPLHGRLRDEATYFSFLTSGPNGLGLDAAEAHRRIVLTRTPEFQARVEARRALLTGNNGLTARLITEDSLARTFGDDARAPWFSQPGVGNPIDRGVLLQTYRQSFEHHFAATGDEATALAAAQADIRRSYGVTGLSGDTPRVVRNPIEGQYPAIDGSRDYIRTQLAALILAERGITVRPEHIFFESTPATQQAINRGGLAAGQLPPYAFYWMRPGQDDRPQTIPGRVFVPDLADARRRALERAAAIEEAARPEPRTLGPRQIVPRPAPDTPPPRSGPQFAPPTLMREGREIRRQSVLDLFGFGARVVGAN